jgi:bifunctional DNase/RNase
MDIDCRPSDAIALAVRSKVPVFIEEDVMNEIGITPEPDISESELSAPAEAAEGEDPASLDAFQDFVDTLDFDYFDEE